MTRPDWYKRWNDHPVAMAIWCAVCWMVTLFAILK